MKLSFKWLKEYVNLDDSITPQIVADKLSTSGFEIEEFFNTGCNIDGIVIGHIKSKIPHPNADKLSICQVDIGQETTQIVCGAPNVDQGQKVPVSTVGTDLGAGFVIKASKIRGEESNGMICSEAELNLSNESDGIMILETDLAPGTKFSEYFEDSDVVFDLSITPNRPDCLSHIGIAKELAVMFECEFNANEKEIDKAEGQSEIKITVDEDSSCERFTAQIIKNVKVADSPKWLKDRLISVGLRPINNLVDISNYIMFDLGQPMHFYDYDKISGKELKVRRCVKGEKVLTLDGNTYELNENETVIEDAEKFAGLGGMMGGKESEVSENTVNVLVEAAIWNNVQIQKSQRQLNLLTDASYRYSKGVDHNLVISAQEKAAALILELCGGELVGEMYDYQKFTVEAHQVRLRVERNNMILGTDIEEKTINHILTSLDFKKESDGNWTIPTNRQDITREIDLIEEVARIVGLDKIPAKEQTVVNYDIEDSFELDAIDALKDYLAANSAFEIVTNSMVNLELHKPFSKKNAIEIINPLSDEMNSMRTSLIPSMLKVLEYNLNRQNLNLSFFEINKDYFAKKNKSVETRKLLLALTGLRKSIHWSDSERKTDFYDIKGFAESILDKMNFPSYDFLPCGLAFLDAESLKIEYKNNPIAFLGKLDKKVQKEFKLSQEVFLLELNLDAIFSIVKPKIKIVSEVSKFPMVERDLALILKKSVKSSDLIDDIEKYCGNVLVKVDIVDKYENKKKHKDDEHSLAFRLYLQSDHTLTDEEIDPIFRGVINLLTEKYNAYLRDS